MEIYAVKINGLDNPIGYRMDSVTCSWKIRDARGQKQSYAKIEVSLSDAFTDLLTCVEGENLDSLGTALEIRLAPCTRYYFRITVTSDAGETAQSDTGWFETAKLDSPWTAKWIGIPDDEMMHPEFSKAFGLSGDIAQARLYICGLGLFEAYINDKKAGDDLLAPFINDYRECFQYCTYDVTDLLKIKNRITVRLGKGWYMGRFGLSQTFKLRGDDGVAPHFALIAELHVRLSDGSTQIIGTDCSWKYRRSVFELTDIYDGETQNYSRAHGRFHDAIIVDSPGRLSERYSLPLHGMEHLPVAELIHTPAGETVLDFGQNFAGFVRCTQQIPAGQAMTMEFGEILQNGCFYRDNYRTAKSRFTYISDGEDRVIFPRFTFFGFRYVKVSGLDNIDAQAFTGVAVYSQMDRTGYLETGNDKINQLHSNVLWGLKSNFVDIPTDCPQRDERLAYTGDTQVFCRTAGYLMDTRAFYSKYLRDLRSDQKRCGGKVALYLPNEFPGICAAVWSDAATFIPKMLYEYYGGKQLLAEQYPIMKDWVDSVRREDCKRGERYLWDFGFQFGDWLALDGATPQCKHGRTDSGFIASAYYYASVCYVAQVAEELSYPEAYEYSKLAKAIREAILNEYYTTTGRLAVDTQTGYLVALRFGLYSNMLRTVEDCKQRFKQDMYRIKGGFVGATMMNVVLSDSGMTNTAYDMLFNEGFPGWLYAVNLGATTIWERWNSVLPDGRMSGTEMNSLNHYSFGAVMEFMYRCAAGISAIAPGFRRARISPHPDIRLRHLECRFESASGQYISSWCIKEDGRLNFHIEIPFGCEAEILLPESESITVGTGSYDYTVTPVREYRAIFSEDTPVERLLENEEAKAILAKYAPDTIKAAMTGDDESVSMTLKEMRDRAKRILGESDDYDKAIQELRSVFPLSM